MMAGTQASSAAPVSGHARIQELVDHFRAGGSLGPLLGLVPRGMAPAAQEGVYQVAHTLYRNGQYEKAAQLFSYLLLIDHVDRRYHMGYAACLQLQGRHAEAVGFYGMASMLDMTDPAPPIHMAECHLARGERTQARQALEYALGQARGHARHSKFVPRAEGLLALLAAPEAGAAA